MVKINGESLEIAGRTIAQYIATTSYDIRRIAIEKLCQKQCMKQKYCRMATLWK